MYEDVPLTMFGPILRCFSSMSLHYHPVFDYLNTTRPTFVD